jgi:hypothetical protein
MMPMQDGAGGDETCDDTTKTLPTCTNYHLENLLLSVANNRFQNLKTIQKN